MVRHRKKLVDGVTASAQFRVLYCGRARSLTQRQRALYPNFIVNFLYEPLLQWAGLFKANTNILETKIKKKTKQQQHNRPVIYMRSKPNLGHMHSVGLRFSRERVDLII